MNFPELLLTAGVPTAISGLLVWWVQYYIQRRDKKKDEENERQNNERQLEQLKLQESINAQEKKAHERAQIQERYNLLLLESMSAVEILAEATARAVQRIPDAKCNGDMAVALEQAERIAEEKNKFLHEQAVQNIYD